MLTPPTLLGDNIRRHSLPDVCDTDGESGTSQSGTPRHQSVVTQKTVVQPPRAITTDTATSAVVQVVHRGCMTTPVAAAETPMSAISPPGIVSGALSPTLSTHHSTTPQLPSHNSIDDLFEALGSSDFEEEQEPVIEDTQLEAGRTPSSISEAAPGLRSQPPAPTTAAAESIHVSKSTIHQSVQTVHSMPVSVAPKHSTIRLDEIQSFIDRVSTPRYPDPTPSNNNNAEEDNGTTPKPATQVGSTTHNETASSAPSIDPTRFYFAAEEASRSVVRAAWESRWWAIAQDFHKTTSEYQSDLAARQVIVSQMAAEHAAESNPTMHHVFELIVTPPVHTDNGGGGGEVEDIPAFQFVGTGNHHTEPQPTPSNMMEVSGMFTPISIASDVFAHSSSMVKYEAKSVPTAKANDLCGSYKSSMPLWHWRECKSPARVQKPNARRDILFNSLPLPRPSFISYQRLVSLLVFHRCL